MFTITIFFSVRVLRSSPQFGVTLLTYEVLHRIFQVDFGGRWVILQTLFIASNFREHVKAKVRLDFWWKRREQLPIFCRFTYFDSRVFYTTTKCYVVFSPKQDWQVLENINLLCAGPRLSCSFEPFFAGSKNFCNF